MAATVVLALAPFATVVAILGLTVLHERPAGPQLAGVALAIVGTSSLAVTLEPLG